MGNHKRSSSKWMDINILVSDVVFSCLLFRSSVKHFIISLFLLCTLAFELYTYPGCKSPTSPTINNLQPGRRDYTWTVDTLNAGTGNIFYLFSLWGSSPQDVWAAGSGGSADLCLWHFDGVSWKQDKSGPSSNLMSVYGFAQNNVWTCDGGIFHYNGQNWSTNYQYNVTGERLLLNNIWGDGPNNIYAVGGIDILDGSGNYKGAVMHFNGSAWSIVSIPDLRVDFAWIRKDQNDGKYYLTATRYESVGDTEKIYQLDGNTVKQIYSGQDVATVNEVAGNVYLCIGKTIYKYQNNKLISWKDFSGTTYLGRMWGRSEKDFFGVTNGGLAHYNGTNLQLLYPTNMLISDVAVFTNDVFILAWNTNNDITIVAHGILK